MLSECELRKTALPSLVCSFLFRLVRLYVLAVIASALLGNVTFLALRLLVWLLLFVAVGRV